jgi:hypothetical protein
MIFCIINYMRHKCLNIKDLQNQVNSNPPFGITNPIESLTY